MDVLIFFVLVFSRGTFGQVSPILRENVRTNLGTQSVCYQELGCIVVDESWFSVHRPLNPLPLHRHRINTFFVLHTRERPKGTVVTASQPETFKVSAIKVRRPTKFIIHGYTRDGSEPWIQSMIYSWLTRGDFNVINVRWGGGSGRPYHQAVANARLVGLEIAYLVNTLTTHFGVTAADVHLIGFSLGAHVAGYAGQQIPQLGRITGLDPAGPLFHHTPPFMRLDASDAQFVDVLHTNGVHATLQIGKGLIEPIGHLDFYANGGSSQPNCGDPIKDFRSGCSHNRAHAIFNDTINLCQVVAYECSSYAAFKRGRCRSCGSDNSRCALVGADADSYPLRHRTRVKLYFDTGATHPFC